MKHDGSIETGFIDPDYQATCSCGWNGNVWPDQSAADKELRDHYASTEATQTKEKS